MECAFGAVYVKDIMFKGGIKYRGIAVKNIGNLLQKGNSGSK
jgi:hypothetical protein